jgi:hypothetical protein
MRLTNKENHVGKKEQRKEERKKERQIDRKND